MKINLHIDYGGGVSREVVANAADMVAFEDKFNVSVSTIGTDPKISYLYYLAWHSEKRTGQTKDSFEKWLETIENVGAGDGDPKSEG